MKAAGRLSDGWRAIARGLFAAAVIAGCSGLVGPSSAAELIAERQWGSWRGPAGRGVAPFASPPVEWSESTNLRFKAELPGAGHSTPIVWGDRVFVTAAVPIGDALPPTGRQADGAHHNVEARRRLQFVVVALDRDDGALVWQRAVHEGRPHESTHESGSWASGSAVTDGEVLVASFGSIGVFGLDLGGEVLWRRDLGDMRIKHGHGEGSSPALAGETVVVNWDHEGSSFVVGLDKRTGEERWRAERNEGTSWSSPTIVRHAGRDQAIIAASERVRAYDVATGERVWECGGLSGNVVASPVAADGLVVVANSYETREMIAIRLDGAEGDVTGTDAVAWTRHRDTPYVPSPSLDDGTLCFLKHYQGILTCLAAADGSVRFGPSRLPGIANVYASLAVADGRLYVVGRDGTTVVLSHGGDFRVLATNRLDDTFSASPAIVGDSIYLRGSRSLYRIARPATGP